MIRPLYSEIATLKMAYSDGNAGLWYDKYCNRWRRGRDNWSLESDGDKTINPKNEWIEEFAGKKVGDKDLLEEFNFRFCTMLAARGQSPMIFLVEPGRFVTGLGREHPVENGFAWHHALGVPYLPGSSIKGMVRAWATQWLDVDSKDRDRILGNNVDEGAGTVIFLDAVPLDPVRLEADIMTPHYGPYYQNQNSEPPADWHNPIPIPFLTVAAGARFLFGVLPRCIKDIQANADCQTAKKWLDESLAAIGAGAKTAVGYGRFRRDDKATDKLREEASRHAEAVRRAARTPEEQEIENLRGLLEAQRVRNERDAGSKAAQELSRLLNSAGTWKKDEQIQLAELADEIVHFLRYSKQKLKERQKQIAELRN